MTVTFTLNDNDSTVLLKKEFYQLPAVNDYIIINDKKYQVLTRIFQSAFDEAEIFVHEIIEN